MPSSPVDGVAPGFPGVAGLVAAPGPEPAMPPLALALSCSSACVKRVREASISDWDALFSMGRRLLLHSRRKLTASLPFHSALEIRLLTWRSVFSSCCPDCPMDLESERNC